MSPPRNVAMKRSGFTGLVLSVGVLLTLLVLQLSGALSDARTAGLTSAATGGACNQSVEPTGIPPGSGNMWCLSMDDEFGQDAALNTALWEPNWLGASDAAVTPPVNAKSESACYDPAEVTVSGGLLNLNSEASACTVNGTTYPYRSGMVQTNGPGPVPLFQQTFGAFEARIYLPAQPVGRIGNWPAFWADGQSFPTDGEMDIMEGLSGQACFHFHSPSGAPGSCVSGDFTGWHTYGADWENGSVTYYYDGTNVGSISSGITSAPMYVILDNAVGGSGGQTLVPDDMQVSDVRVWQQVATTTTTTSSTTTTTSGSTTTTTGSTTTTTSSTTTTTVQTTTTTKAPATTTTTTPRRRHRF